MEDRRKRGGPEWDEELQNVIDPYVKLVDIDGVKTIDVVNQVIFLIYI
jgi:hypothetical protein